MTALNDLHRQIAAIVLEASADYPAALAGGNALLAHGVGSRLTEDVDIFVDRLKAVTPAVEKMIEALRAAGFSVAEHDKMAELQDWWDDPELGEGLAELEVTPAAGVGKVQLQVSFFTLMRPPVHVPGIGPVVDLQDAAARKAAAACSRRAERDLIDLASLVDAGFTVRGLMKLAMECDEGLRLSDFADVGDWLDALKEKDLRPYLPEGKTGQWVRDALAEWPREAQPRVRKRK